MRILIVEDDYVGRKLLQKYLSKFGECDLAVDGLEAVDCFLAALNEDKPYKLICLDIMMPKVDGLQALKTIRSIEEQRNVPEDTKAKIIMTTALNDKQTVLKSYDSGSEAYASKPIDLEKFREVLVNLGLISFP